MASLRIPYALMLLTFRLSDFVATPALSIIFDILKVPAFRKIAHVVYFVFVFIFVFVFAHK